MARKQIMIVLWSLERRKLHLPHRLHLSFLSYVEVEVDLPPCLLARAIQRLFVLRLCLSVCHLFRMHGKDKPSNQCNSLLDSIFVTSKRDVKIIQNTLLPFDHWNISVICNVFTIGNASRWYLRFFIYQIRLQDPISQHLLFHQSYLSMAFGQKLLSNCCRDFM